MVRECNFSAEYKCRSLKFKTLIFEGYSEFFLLIRHSKIECRIPVAKFCRCTAWHFQIKIFVLLLLTWHQAIFYATSTLFSVLNFSKGKPKWKNFFFSFFFSHSFAKEANFYFKCHPTQITRKAITDLLSHSEYSLF